MEIYQNTEEKKKGKPENNEEVVKIGRSKVTSMYIYFKYIYFTPSWIGMRKYNNKPFPSNLSILINNNNMCVCKWMSQWVRVPMRSRFFLSFSDLIACLPSSFQPAFFHHGRGSCLAVVARDPGFEHSRNENNARDARAAAVRPLVSPLFRAAQPRL